MNSRYEKLNLKDLYEQENKKKYRNLMLNIYNILDTFPNTKINDNAFTVGVSYLEVLPETFEVIIRHFDLLMIPQILQLEYYLFNDLPEQSPTNKALERNRFKEEYVLFIHNSNFDMIVITYIMNLNAWGFEFI